MLATSSSDDEDYSKTNKKKPPSSSSSGLKQPPPPQQQQQSLSTPKAGIYSQPTSPNVSHNRLNTATAANNVSQTNNKNQLYTNAATTNAMAGMHLTNGVGDSVSMRSSFSNSNEQLNNNNRLSGGAGVNRMNNNANNYNNSYNNANNNNSNSTRNSSFKSNSSASTVGVPPYNQTNTPRVIH